MLSAIGVVGPRPIGQIGERHEPRLAHAWQRICDRPTNERLELRDHRSELARAEKVRHRLAEPDRGRCAGGSEVLYETPLAMARGLFEREPPVAGTRQQRLDATAEIRVTFDRLADLGVVNRHVDVEQADDPFVELTRVDQVEPDRDELAARDQHELGIEDPPDVDSSRLRATSP
jgi:hypothetical protein